MKRVLYIGMENYLGGIEVFCINFYRVFNPSEVQIDFIKFSESIYFEEEICKKGGTVYKLTHRRKNPLKFYLDLFNFFKNHKEYEIVHIHLNTCSCIAPVIIPKLYNRKVIVHSHNEWKGKNKMVKMRHEIGKKLIPFFSDKYLACSQKAGEWMFGNKQFTVINNAIDTNKFLFNKNIRTKYRREMSIDDKFVVGNIGRLHLQKNHEFLLDIFKAVYDKNPNTVLLLVGEGSSRSIIEEKIAKLGLQESAILLGARSDVPELLQSMDVFVLTSHFEGLGIVAIEAQAASLPCVVANTVPKEAFITESIQSIGLDESVDIWAEAILEKMNYKREEENNSVKEQGYDIYESVRKLEDIYRDMVSI